MTEYAPSPERWEKYVQDERRNQRDGQYPPEHGHRFGRSVAFAIRLDSQSEYSSTFPASPRADRKAFGMLTSTWERMIDAFLRDQRAGGKPKTTCDARRQHLMHLAKRVRAGSPWDVSLDALKEYTAAQSWAIETRRGRRTTLVQFWRWGVEVGHTDTVVAEGLPKIKIAPAKARPAPDRVYHEAVASAKPRERLMLRLAAEVGMRRAEVAQVHTDDLMEDLVGHSLIVHGKGGRERIVPLPASIGRTLADVEKGYVFPGADHGHL